MTRQGYSRAYRASTLSRIISRRSQDDVLCNRRSEIGKDVSFHKIKVLPDCFLTLYAFSTENWNRSRVEVAGLLSLLAKRIDRETRVFHEGNVRLIRIGRVDRLSQKLRQKIEAATELTKSSTGLTLCLAFDYGGRDEIVQAARRLSSDNIPDSMIDETVLSQFLYTAGIPDPALIIRTGGEIRLSNFLLWQAAYSELYFTPVLWPDFGQKEIEEALSEYRRRRRRFHSA
jgi:undecaprenyl diphosphate synthase